MIGLFVTGTGTGVGKTVVASVLAGIFSGRGCTVGVLKPVQTGAGRNSTGVLQSPDILFMASTCGCDADRVLLNPYCYEPACSPHLAAELAGEPICPEKIESAYRELSGRYDIVIVEGAGGLMVPLASDFFICDLVEKLNIPLLIVSQNILGTINHSILTVRQAFSCNLNVLGIIFNHPIDSPVDFVEERNPGIVQDLTGVEVFGTVPYYPQLSALGNLPEQIIKSMEKHINLDSLMRKLGV